VWQHLHRAERQNDTNSYLVLPVHLQSLNNEDRDDTKRPIRDATQRRVSIEAVDHNLCCHAMSLTTTKLLPEM
jgi:hypothetical protein